MARKSILGERNNTPAPLPDIDIESILAEIDQEDGDQDDQDILEPARLTLPESQLDPVVTTSKNYQSKWKNELPSDFDIFRDLTGEWLEKNAKQPVYYVIYRDSRSNYVAERYPPYSWAKLQQEFGAGYYIVIAKERGTNRVVIQQPRLVEDFKATEKQSDVKKEPEVSVNDIGRILDEKLSIYRPKEPQTQQPSITELLTLVFSLQEKAVSRQPQGNDSALIGNIINLVQAQNEKSSQTAQEQSRMMIEMFTKMAENTNSVVRAINENQQKMFEKMNERIETVVKEINRPAAAGLSYSPQEIIEMQQRAQQTGFEMWSRLETMAESKARQRIEIIESIKSEEIEEVKPKPFTEKLFESMMPALGAVMTGLARQNATGVPAQPQIIRPVQSLPHPNNVRQMPQRPTAQVNPQQPRPVQQAKPVQPVQQAKQQPQPQPQPQSKPQPKPPTEAVKTEVSNDFDDLPSVDFGSVDGPDYMSNPKFAEYIQILQPILVESWTAKSSIEETSDKLLSSLQAQGVSREDFLENVRYDDVEDALSDFDLAPEVFTWLRGLYAHLEASGGIFINNGTVG
jgi:hypothetical protein